LDSPQALNVLMLKILENSNRNFTFSALLTLLLDTPAELSAAAGAAAAAAAAAAGHEDAPSAGVLFAQQQARWADLVVKCLIKSTKALPQVIQVCAQSCSAWPAGCMPSHGPRPALTTARCWSPTPPATLTAPLFHTQTNNNTHTQSIDVCSLLHSIHGFFEALGVEEIRRRSQADDKPLRMVKTILHELCKTQGLNIYKCVAY
jgi:hypothetical protein